MRPATLLEIPPAMLLATLRAVRVTALLAMVLAVVLVIVLVMTAAAAR
jgi:hypothetical protein